MRDLGTTELAIGELASQAGITVRTLRHYDQIGLLTPEGRTASGHRRYSAHDVERLYEVTALRQLGVSLERIGAVLDSDDGRTLGETLAEQLAAVKQAARANEELVHQIEGVLATIDLGNEPTTTALINTTEMTNMTVRLNRIVTRTGDGGNTHLGDASQIAKDQPRVQAMGDVDELNSSLGLVIDQADVEPNLARLLLSIQNQLFDLGSDLATPVGLDDDRHRIDASYTAALETECDALVAQLKPLDSFVLPSGGLVTSHLHVARSICRRAERSTVVIAADSNPEVQRYLNRLSDLLFLLARSADGGKENLWQPGGSD